MYIRATGNISPQNTFGSGELLENPVLQPGNRMACVEPDYKELIDPKMIRRMSRIIRMGVAAASACLKAAEVTQPDAIITGTAYGCLEDTGVFLSKMVEFNEELLTPTAFIQSTHNTIGAQIALLLKCHHYNNAFVHRGFSFETALLDAVLLLKDEEAATVLVGGVDEITDISHAILSRLGLYRNTVAGEGAAFFLLSANPSVNDAAKLEGLATCYKPENKETVQRFISAFLEKHNTALSDIDLIISGRNGDTTNDAIFEELGSTAFAGKPFVNYKQLCGEYPTSTAFAMWLAVHILKNQAVPELLVSQPHAPDKLKKILIYNHSQNIHHSLLLISAC